MTCVWNGNLHRQRVNRSKMHHQKQFLHLHHWTENQKSRECNEHIWFVVKLRIGPVTAFLTHWQVYTWKTIATIYSKTRTPAPQNSQSRNNSTFSPLKKHAQKVHSNTSKDMCHLLPSTSLDPSSTNWTSFMLMFSYIYELSIIQWLNSPNLHLQADIMDATHYWPFAWEYSIWNATATALQFWTADLESHILSNAIEWVYTAFFHSNSTQQLQNLPEEAIFSCFMTILNNTFEIEHAQEDKGYESGSQSLNIPTPLRRVPQIYHLSMSENLSFNPITPLMTAKQYPVHSPRKFRCCSPVQHHLVFSSSDKESPVRPSDSCLQHSSTPDRSPVCRGA